MAHNGAKTTQTLAGSVFRSSFVVSGCDKCIWQEVAYNGSKRFVETTTKELQT